MRRFPSLVFCLICPAILGSCTTHVVIEQPKPLDINLNVHGDFRFVIEDARQNLEQINGAKPNTVVRPEDIGLPPSGSPGAALRDADAIWFAGEEAAWSADTVPVLFTTRPAKPAQPLVPIAAIDDVKKSMAARYAKVQALWDEKLAGESHTGLLEPKGKLSAEQQKLLADENADRAALYAADAKTTGNTMEKVVLGYYLARLGYAKPGNWYEEYNKTTNRWEWKQTVAK